MAAPFDCRYLKNHELSNDDDDSSENVNRKSMKTNLLN